MPGDVIRVTSTSEARRRPSRNVDNCCAGATGRVDFESSRYRP